MKQQVIPGGTIEALTAAEAVELLKATYRETVENRVRAAAIVQLDANGNGEDDVYAPPVGFEADIRRVLIDMDKATDPLTGAVILGPALVANWTLNNAPAVNTQATATRAATPGVAHVLQEIAANVQTGAVAPAAVDVVVVVRDGASGVGPILWQTTLAVPAATNTDVGVNLAGLNIVGTPGNAMTVEFTAAAGANTSEVVSAGGIDTSAEPGAGGGKTVEYLRGVAGTRIEWGQPQYGSNIQIPGVQTWGSEQGPYIRNGETFAVRLKGLTAGAIVVVTVEAIQRRPPKDRD